MTGDEADELSALRRALADAVREIDEHNIEHDYVTPEVKLEAWRSLARVGSMGEVFARLDKAGLEMRSGLTESTDAALRAVYHRAELEPTGLRMVIDAWLESVFFDTVELSRWDDDGGAVGSGA